MVIKHMKGGIDNNLNKTIKKKKNTHPQNLYKEAKKIIEVK